MPTRRRRLAAALLLAVLVAACGPDGDPEPSTGGDRAPLATDDPEPAQPPGEAAGPATPDTTAPPAGLRAEAGRQRIELVVGDRVRSATAVVPVAALERPVPVVLAFHGFGQVTDAFLDVADLPSAAEANAWVLLAPDGLGRSFDAGGCCAEATDVARDDVALARALLAEAEAVLGWEAPAVVATGFSNGGMMSHRLGCEAADVVDAIVPASGGLQVEACAPAEPIVVHQVHGSSDLVVPPSRGRRAVELWADVLNCTDVVRDEDGDDGLEGATWSGCDDGATVRWSLRRGAGHDWFGGPPLDTNAVIAATVTAILADG